MRIGRNMARVGRDERRWGRDRGEGSDGVKVRRVSSTVL